MKKSILLSMGALFTLTACSPREDGSYTRASLGLLSGALLGGLVGNQFGGGFGKTLFTAGGALWGGSTGYAWGAKTDIKQLQSKTKTTEKAMTSLPTDTYSVWVDPRTGATSTMRPLETVETPMEAATRTQQYQQLNSGKCRIFETTRSGGYAVVGMACLDNYGRWRLMD